MNTERKINWKQVFQDAQDTLDAQDRGEISRNETLVTASGREYAQDLETGTWISIPISGQMKIVDNPGSL